MDENGEILLLHASKNNVRPLVLPCALYTLLLGYARSFVTTLQKRLKNRWNFSCDVIAAGSTTLWQQTFRQTDLTGEHDS